MTIKISTAQTIGSFPHEDGCPALDPVAGGRQATPVAQRLGSGSDRWDFHPQSAAETLFFGFA